MVTTSTTQSSFRDIGDTTRGLKRLGDVCIGETLRGLKPLGDICIGETLRGLKPLGDVCIGETLRGSKPLGDVCIGDTLRGSKSLGGVRIGETLRDLLPVGDSRIGETLRGLKPRGEARVLLGNGDAPTWSCCFLRGEFLVGVACFAELSTGDFFAAQLFFDFCLPCLFPLPRSARCFSLDRNSFASSCNCLPDFDGEEPVMLTSSSSLTECVEEDFVELRPLARGVSGTIVISDLGGETSKTYKESTRRCEYKELRIFPR